MKLFKRNKDNDLKQDGTYDSDDDSIPPPPPPPPQGPTTTDGQASVVSSVKTSDEQFLDTPRGQTDHSVSTYNRNMEHSRLVTNPTNDENNGVPSPHNGYSQVPMTGYFRGMRKAQSFDEEEAGMDEIEVPSSSVVDRLNRWEKKYALRRRWRIFALILLVVVGIVAVALGSVFGGGGASPTGELGGGSSLLDTPSGRVIMENDSLPASTKNALERGDESSAAFKALQWIQTSDTNQNYNFDDETVLTGEDAKLNLMQRFSLASIYFSFNGAIDGWMGEDDVCVWNGVKCNGDVVRKLQEGASTISSLDLNSMDLEGPIPSEIAMLEDLEQLIMFGNLMTGEIPKEIFSLRKLEVLDVFNNRLSGSIPSDIKNLDRLVGLYIGKNEFTGTIPTELFSLVSLVELWLNDITTLDRNPLPNEIGELENLQQLLIDKSNFNGNLPDTIGSLVNLREFTASSNIFNGEIPDLSTLVNLEILDLSRNWFSGGVPRLVNLGNLKVLKLNGNILSGRIPNHYGTLEKLVELRLGPNTFEGFDDAGLTDGIPESLSLLQNLEILDLQNNKLSGEIPEALGDLANLERFMVQGNDFVGAVPGAICELEPQELEADCEVGCACCTDACNRN